MVKPCPSGIQLRSHCSADTSQHCAFPQVHGRHEHPRSEPGRSLIYCHMSLVHRIIVHDLVARSGPMRQFKASRASQSRHSDNIHRRRLTEHTRLHRVEENSAAVRWPEAATIGFVARRDCPADLQVETTKPDLCA
jgi:hypothetical protein